MDVIDNNIWITNVIRVIPLTKNNSFYLYPPFSGIASCVGTTEVVQTPTLDSALLCSSRAGTYFSTNVDIFT